MSSNLQIVVITHELDDFENKSYLLNRCCEEWKRRDVSILVLKGVRQDLPPADLAILHTDITVVSDAYAKIIDHYPKIINGRVRDISKTAFSDLIVSRESNYPGPVIVKTNANYGGMWERRERHQRGEGRSLFEILRLWSRVECLEKYPVFDSATEVPHGVWKNRNLVVEKFLTEQNNNNEYLLRIWVFFGDREIYYQCVSSEPVIKGHNTIRREYLDVNDIPESLRETRVRLGFDFGKFDFSMLNGQPVLYDVNRTPGSPKNIDFKSRQALKNIRMLSTGLDCFTD